MHGDKNCARKQKKAKSNMVIDGLGRCIHTSIMTWVVPQPELGGLVMDYRDGSVVLVLWLIIGHLVNILMDI